MVGMDGWDHILVLFVGGPFTPIFQFGKFFGKVRDFEENFDKSKHLHNEVFLMLEVFGFFSGNFQHFSTILDFLKIY